MKRMNVKTKPALGALALLGLGIAIGIGLAHRGEPGPKRSAGIDRAKVITALQATAMAIGRSEKARRADPAEAQRDEERKIAMMTLTQGYLANPAEFYGQPEIRRQTLSAREIVSESLRKRFGEGLQADMRMQALNHIDAFMESTQNPLMNPFAGAQQQQNSLASHSVQSLTH